MLNDVHVRGRRGPGDCGDVVGCKPAGCETGGVFPIIVLLEEEVARLEAMIMDGTQEGLLENATVNLSIHDALDAVQASKMTQTCHNCRFGGVLRFIGMVRHPRDG